ncbi:MAG: MFS transporter, partial [Chthoniobacterales bacterium]|nr:MFS transporter [Chthoniobacterales bacterium]
IHQLGVRTALAIVGLGISLLLLLASRWMTFPPHIPPSDSNSNPPKQAIPHHSSTPWFAALLTNRKFLTLWICFFLGTFLGLTAIGISASVGQELFHLSPLQAASWLSLFALFNGLARPPLGALADRFPPSWLAGFLYFIAGTASLLFYFLPKTSVLLYVSGFSALWFTLGGWLALAPATTARLFGQQHFARNYGLLFTAYGFGALSGTLSAGRLRDFTGSYVSVFLLLAAVAFLGIILASQIRTTKSN